MISFTHTLLFFLFFLSLSICCIVGIVARPILEARAKEYQIE